jgi:transcriptional regulator with XRE-family HTH domain
MTSEDFTTWRKAMGLKRSETAALLGLKKRAIRDFEKGQTKNRRVVIPKTVELACYALSRGVSEFDGKTAKNSFSGLGAAEDIQMVKPKSKSARRPSM